MTYVIGIDGGGTKTKAVIADGTGAIIASETVGPTNPNLISTEELHHTLDVLLRGLGSQAPEQYKKVTYLFAGVSGAGVEQSRISLFHVLTKLVSDYVTIRVESDTINALYSGTFGKPGIVQIAGTGSITYGINNKSEHDRVGGWGYLFGDEGSGFDIGRQGIMAVLKSDDGRGPKTILTEKIYAFFGVTHARDLIQKVYTATVPKNDISPLSRVVFQAYKKNDPAAVAIINGVAKEISISIKTLYKKLFDFNETVDAVLCGGVFNEIDIVPPLIKRELGDLSRIKPCIPEMSPVGGSVIGAYLMQGSLPGPTIIKKMITSLQVDDS